MGEDFGFFIRGFGDGEGSLKPRSVDFAVAVGGGGVDLVGGLLFVPEGFAGGGIDGDELAGEVGGVDAVFDEDG